MKIRSLLRNTIIMSSISLILVSCTTQAAKSLTPKLNLAKSSEVTFNINKYTDGLDNLNELLMMHGDKTINLLVQPITNKTGGAGQELPADISMMVNSALNEIGEQVSLYSVAPEGESLENFYLVEGAITEFDVLESSNAGVNAALHLGKGRGEADMDSSASDDNQISKITLDFNIIDGFTGKYVSKVHTSNSIKVVKESASKDFGFSILGSGFGLNASVSKEQGKHAAIRLLVDLSMIELIGKLQKKPYWICVPGAKKDRRLFRDIKRNFEKLSDSEKVNAVTQLLSLSAREISEKSVKDYKKEYGLFPIDSNATSELYISLLETVYSIKQKRISITESNKKFSGML